MSNESKEKDSQPDAGVAEGEEVITQAGEPTGEHVVYDKDKDGKVIGWHKETIKEK